MQKNCRQCNLSFISKKALYCCAECRKKGAANQREKTNLELFGVSNASQSIEIKEKIKNTFINKYGKSNPMQIKEINDKMHNTMIKKYGASHALSVELIKEKFKKTMIEVYGAKTSLESELLKEKIYKTTEEKYGNKIFSISHISQDNYEKLNNKEWLSTMCKNHSVNEIKNILGVGQNVINQRCREFDIETKKSTSKFEEEIADFLKENNIIFERHNRSLLNGQEIDIYIESLNLGIECNGSYWHSEIAGGKGKNYHLNKSILLKNKGVQLVHIWEHEWILHRHIIESFLLSKIGKSKKLYAKNFIIQHVPSKLERKFLENNHIQGFVPSGCCVGLFNDNELYCLMSFGKGRYDKNSKELLRFVTKTGYTIVGGASKLFNFYVKSYNIPAITSYSHRDKFTGNLYKQLGFEYSHSTDPSYYYTQDYLNFDNRVKFQKHKLSAVLENFNSELSEWINMKNNGYDRIWDCGNDVWVWTNNNLSHLDKLFSMEIL